MKILRFYIASVLLSVMFTLAACGSDVAVVNDANTAAAEDAAEDSSELQAALAEMQVQIDALQAELDTQETEPEAVQEAPAEAEPAFTELEGIWDVTRGGSFLTIDIDGYGTVPVNTIEFRVNRFYTTQYVSRSISFRHGEGGYVWELRAPSFVGPNWADVPFRGRVSQQFNPATWVQNQDAPPESGRGDHEVLNSSFADWRFSTSGTFSISGNNVELVFDDGWIVVYEFQATANTLTITDRHRFIYHRR